MSFEAEKPFPKKRSYHLSIAIPASIVSDVPHLREKTFKIGLVGRAAAIFRVDEVIVFPDIPATHQDRDIDLVTTILSYMDTPQYLRKRLFEVTPELRYAGVLPPLRTPHHPLSKKMKELKVGEYREGVVLSSSRRESLVDIGVERPAITPKVQLLVNTRVTVKITELKKRLEASVADRDEVESYWGYRVTRSGEPFCRLVGSQAFDLVVATSRYGTPIKEAMDKLTRRWKASKKILVAFGAPSQGLHKIAAHEGIKLEDIAGFIVNTIPDQGTETVRTDEALYASLAILNSFVD